MNDTVSPKPKKDAKELRRLQKEWLDDIMERSGDNLVQMAEACNVWAERSKQKPINPESLRHFYQNYQSASSGTDRLLAPRTVFLLHKAYQLEPSFAPDLLYDMDKDDAEVSLYVKHCKQYITDVSKAKGIYRTDLARGMEPKLADSIMSRLFNDSLPRGLQMKTLEAIKDTYGVNFSPRFRLFLETHEDTEQLTVIGSLELRSGEDRVWLHAENDRKRLALSFPFLKAKQVCAVELTGPDISPFLRSGMLMVYQDGGEGVAKSCINQTCIVQTADEHWHVKVVKRSDKPNQYRLESVVSSGIEECALKCAYKIELMVMPGL